MVNSANTSWAINLDGRETNIDLRHCSFKLWITDMLSVDFGDTPDRITSLIPRVYRFDIGSLNLHYISFTFDEFRCLTSFNSLFKLIFYKVIMKHADGSLVDLVQILERIPRIYYFY